MEPPREIILFDGICNLCSRSVRFIIRRDPVGRFLFCPLQSDEGRALLRAYGLPTDELDSLVLVAGDRAYRRSDAALRICAGLRPPWRWLTLLRGVPRPLRDAAYDVVAHRRYRWFGRTAACRIPTGAEHDRFLGGASTE